MGAAPALKGAQAQAAGVTWGAGCPRAHHPCPHPPASPANTAQVQQLNTAAGLLSLTPLQAVTLEHGAGSWAASRAASSQSLALPGTCKPAASAPARLQEAGSLPPEPCQPCDRAAGPPPRAGASRLQVEPTNERRQLLVAGGQGVTVARNETVQTDKQHPKDPALLGERTGQASWPVPLHSKASSRLNGWPARAGREGGRGPAPVGLLGLGPAPIHLAFSPW